MRRVYKILGGLVIAVAIAVVVLYVRERAKERAVRFKEGATLIGEKIEGKGRQLSLTFSAEVDVSPEELYHLFVDFPSWREFVPDISYVKVVDKRGNTRIVEMRRYILFLGRELGGKLEYTLHPNKLEVEMKTLNNPHADVHERWQFTKAPEPGRTIIHYHADAVSAESVPLVMARSWMKSNFVDLVNALRNRAHAGKKAG